MITTEAIIVGGGPAGSSCASRLLKHGVEAIVLDAQEFPRTKLCAGWITPRVLSDMGVEPGEYPFPIVKLGRLHLEYFGRRRSWRCAVNAEQYSIRRFEFDDWLLRRSQAPVYRHQVRDIRTEHGHFILDDRFRCRYLVGAGGTHCPVYRHLFREANARSREYQVAALEQEFQYRIDDDACYLWFGEHGLVGYSWYVPKGNGWINVGIGGFCHYLDQASVRLQGHWRALTERLAATGLIRNHAYDPKGHTYYLRDRVKVGQLGNAYVVGDAAGVATRDLGEGIGPAIETGLRAAESIVQRKPYTLDAITTYSILGEGAPQRVFANWIDRSGTLFRDWIYARNWRKKETVFAMRGVT